MIPGQALGTCSKALRRPTWEQSLQLVLLVVLGVSFFFVIFVAFLDSDKVLKDHVNNMSKDKGPVQPTLDLRQIGLQTMSNDELKTSSPVVTKMNGVAYQRKKQDKKRSDVDSINKKSWAEVLAKRFSPIQSDVKFKEDTPPPQPIRPVESKREKQKNLRESGMHDTSKLIEDDSSSTTTENSQQSSSDSSNDSKKGAASKKVNVSIEPQPEPKSLSKNKIAVKKSKSLPISSVVSNKEPEATNPKLVRPTPPKVLSVKDPNPLSTEPKRSNDILKESTNFNTTPDQQKLLTQPKKYGKTPGRERKKNEEKRRPITRGALYKDTAFQMTPPAANTSPASPPIWEINKISFSNVVAQNPFNISPTTSNGPSVQSTSQFYNGQPGKCNYDQQIFDKVPSGIDDEMSEIPFSSNHGPIGTRKSPSSTPVWEPMPSIQKPIPTPVISNPNSFFSGSFPRYSSSDVDEAVSNGGEMDLMAGTSGLLDNVYGIKRSWDSALLLSLLQQQQQKQQGVSKLQSMYTNQNNLWGVNLTQPEKTWSSTPIRPPPGLKPLHEKNATDNAYSEQQRQQQNVLPQFDPFSSLSSIWSTDAWPPNNSNNSESNKKQM